MLSFCAENTYYTVLTSGMVTELLIFKTKRRKSWQIKLFFWVGAVLRQGGNHRQWVFGEKPWNP
jgi:hypothetical protein